MVNSVIFHEGKSDKIFLKLLISELGLDSSKLRFIAMKGKSYFWDSEHPMYQVVKNDVEEENITKLLFIVDADDEKNDEKYGGYENTKRELRNIIKQLELTEYADLYITCNKKKKMGYLEALILLTIPQPQKNCIQDFLNCSEFKSKENHKAILNQIYKIAYPNAPFNFTHQYFDELKQKLTDLLSE
ncbi:hypothetical protein [Candidatus Albibeggiatoa sp. nov. BB20]|uniref:hypothetical protein n=1 Tax=Candidatus Albibeggiatoa sp. nov. BB20 TaxID=3162723 RepID=UPI0033659C19